MPAKRRSWDGTKWRGHGGVDDIEVLDPFVIGTTKPNASNTGLYAPTTSTVTAADTTYSTAGQTITNTLFTGNINVTAANVTFENCEFRGKSTTTSNHIVRVNSSTQSGATFTRCKFVHAFHPSTDGADGAHGGIMGHNVTLTRCDISGGADGIGMATASTGTTLQNVTVEGCYIHDLWFFSPNRDHSDGNHCDGIQGHKALNDVSIIGNTIEGLLDDTLDNSQAGITPVTDGSGNLISGNLWYTEFPDWQGYAYPPWATSAILLGRTGAGGGLTNVTIDRNWLNGGGYAAINLNNGYTDSNCANVVITNNRVGATLRDGYLLICSSSLSADLTFTGNVLEATGAAANSRRNG